MKVLIINGHPRNNSFSDAITAAYYSGAAAARVQLATLVLRDLDFSPNVTSFSPNQQFIEPDIRSAQQTLLWADHVVFVYPTWWGTMPALLKGFIDRVFTAGLAFNEIEGGTGYEPLLRGKTAQLITTMDTPNLIYQLLYRAPGHNAMGKALLEFCGFEMTTTISLAPVRSSSELQRKKWLDRVKARGSSLKYGPLNWKKKLSIRIITWLKALRLQFYPMTAVAYAAGAWSANHFGHTFNATVFWTGYAWLFFLEAATVLINESADYNSDKKNKYFGPFTGGSRMIVEGLLNFKSVRKGIFLCLTTATICLGMVLYIANGNLKEMLLTCFALTVLALGYTARPLKLAYQTLGEITVAITHSFAVIVCGYLFMGGSINDPYPWVLGLPLFFSVLPSITLAGIPDYQADLSAGKRTIAVRFGKKGAAYAAIIFTTLSVLTLIVFTIADLFPIAFKNLLYFALPHAAWLILKLASYIKSPEPPKRIDTIMIAALTYLIWYAVVPLINLT